MDAAWQHLLKYAVRDLADGDQISLDCHNVEGAVSTVFQETSAISEGGVAYEYSEDGCCEIF